MNYKTVQVHENTWKSLHILRVELNTNTLDETIGKLITAYCSKKEVKP